MRRFPPPTPQKRVGFSKEDGGGNPPPNAIQSCPLKREGNQQAERVEPAQNTLVLPHHHPKNPGPKFLSHTDPQIPSRRRSGSSQGHREEGRRPLLPQPLHTLPPGRRLRWRRRCRRPGRKSREARRQLRGRKTRVSRLVGFPSRRGKNPGKKRLPRSENAGRRLPKLLLLLGAPEPGRSRSRAKDSRERRPRREKPLLRPVPKRRRAGEGLSATRHDRAFGGRGWPMERIPLFSPARFTPLSLPRRCPPFPPSVAALGTHLVEGGEARAGYGAGT